MDVRKALQQQDPIEPLAITRELRTKLNVIGTRLGFPMIQGSQQRQQYPQRLTSELVYMAKSLDDNFSQEYQRRLELLDFTFPEIEEIQNSDKAVLGLNPNEGYKEGDHWIDYKRGVPWKSRDFLPEDLKSKKPPESRFLTLSELVGISVELYGEILDQGPINMPRLWEAICYSESNRSDNMSSLENYASIFNRRTKELGFSAEQGDAYAVNELVLFEQSRGKLENIPTWVKQSTNLEEYV
jgi:hypothetical protein